MFVKLKFSCSVHGAWDLITNNGTFAYALANEEAHADLSYNQTVYDSFLQNNKKILVK